MRRTIIISIITVLSLCTFNVNAQRPFKFHQGTSVETFTANEVKDIFISDMIEKTKMLNAQLPIQIDDFTEFRSAVMVGTTIHYNYIIYLDSSLLTETEIQQFWDETKEILENNILFLFKQNEDKMPIAEWKRLYHELDIKYNHNYIDTNGKAFAKIVVEF